MSGGSYDYLYCKEADDLLNMEDRIQEMADRLTGLRYASDAVRETQKLQKLLLKLRQSKNQIDKVKDRLSAVWRAIEWWDSNDSNENGVKEALKEYRRGVKK